MQSDLPEKMARAVVEACADCDICRYLMEDTPCLVFPNLYKLHDKEMETKETASPEELKSLVDLCNFCALCPCPSIRSDIMKAKHAFVDRDGLQRTIRLLENVEQVARVCGAYPRLTNMLFEKRFPGNFLKRLAGIHEKRRLPRFPKGTFPAWAQEQGLHLQGASKGRRVAYFVGCTGQYLFPEVPIAAVEVLRRNGIEVYYPEQKCCGMPSLLEGDLKLTLDFASFNLDRLCETVDAGYDIVCSCPTCGYMLKHVMSEGAFYAEAYRELAGSDENGSDEPDTPRERGQTRPASFSSSIMDKLFKDEGYFTSMNALKRIKVASHTFDLGEYLRDLQRTGEFKSDLGRMESHMAYYPPCHLREQKIGEPYADLLSLVPGISLERIDGAFHCCGIAGIMGFKQGFYQVSIEMGDRLMEKIRAIHPEKLATDCLSCRIQFNQLIPYKVLHPVEILSESYAKYEK
jgi:glycerol-3-phosphate dehydrogenase subunit C